MVSNLDSAGMGQPFRITRWRGDASEGDEDLPANPLILNMTSSLSRESSPMRNHLLLAERPDKSAGS